MRWMVEVPEEVMDEFRHVLVEIEPGELELVAQDAIVGYLQRLAFPASE